MTSFFHVYEQSKKVSFRNRVIPSAWFQNLRLARRNSDFNAILILSEIVAHYYPLTYIDADTSKVSFSYQSPQPLLQRSYKEFAELLDISKDSAIGAMVRLEENGLIKRVFQTLELRTGKLPNVLYIELNPERLQEISQPLSDQSTGNKNHDLSHE